LLFANFKIKKKTSYALCYRQTYIYIFKNLKKEETKKEY